MKNKISLSDHFTFKKIFQYTLAPICTMIFSSIYSIVDGLFISNYVGKTPFAAINLVFPYIIMVAAIGFMFGSGGNALVAKFLGEGNVEKANKSFSLIVYTTSVLGISLSIISFVFSKSISTVLGATPEMLPSCVLYLKVNMVGIVFFMLQNMFQSFLITEGKNTFAFIITLVAGVLNMFLDFLFVGVLRMGVFGAALATILSQLAGGGIPFFYFIFKKKGTLKLAGTSFDFNIIWKAATNGASEFIVNVTSAIVGFVYNLQLLKYYGEDGVSAYGVIMYVGFIFFAIHIGYSMGISPIVSYHYGAQNKNELQNLYKRSIIIEGILNVAMFIASELLATPFAKIFVGYNEELFELTLYGFKVYAICYLVVGFNVFASGFFTALNNGLISGIISFVRAFVLQLIMILALPNIFGPKGLWFVCPAFEFLTVIMVFIFIFANGKKYGYIDERKY